MSEELTTLETVTCSRCGGSGSYSYCTAFGSRCFKCHGKGKVYTKRGLAAYHYLRKIRCIRAADFVCGDLMHFESTYRSYFVKLDKIERREDGQIELSGVNSVHGRSIAVYAPDDLVRKGWTQDEKQAQMRDALAYQATLTKSGALKKARNISR